MNDAREAQAWFASTQFSRRAFTAAATAVTGYAVLAQPVSAAAIATSAEGLVAGRVAIKAADREVPAYRAHPASGNNWPLVLVISEIFGLHAYIEDVVRRFAQAGYYAIAPDYFVRTGDPVSMTDFKLLIDTIVAPTPDAQVLGDSRAALVFAASEGASPTRLGVTGFCWGGRQTWLHIAALPQLKAGVAWYGKLKGEPTARQPHNPIELAPRLTRPVLGLYGEKDQGIPLETVEDMRAALKAAGNPGEIIVYPGAPHGFHADYRPSYQPEAAKAGWTACLAWFKRTL